jgi:outer membrane biosynthesis protein TonB
MRAATRNGGVRAASWMGRGHGIPAPEVTFAQVTPVTFPKRHGFLESSVLRIIRSSGTTPLTQGFAIMRMRYVVGLFLLFSYCFGPVRMAQSQQTSTDTSRRIVRRTIPVYSDVAKRINLAGTVKVIAVVAGDGDVKSVEPMGGSPLLLKAAEEAVLKWKFAPGGESRETVEIRFTP